MPTIPLTTEDRHVNKLEGVEGAQSLDERTFRSRVSQMTKDQLREMSEWGVSKDGYKAGGNFDDNPELKVYTLKKYQELKDGGRLSHLNSI